MKSEEADQLIEKYNNGKASASERALVESWYLKYPEGARLSEQDLLAEHDAGLHRLNAYLDKGRRIRLLQRVAAAATVFLVLSTGIYFYGSAPQGIKDSITPEQDIAPGGNLAVLTLANGDTLNLSSVKAGVVIGAEGLTYTDGARVGGPNATANPGSAEEITAETPRGGTYRIQLSDGTLVVMNSESKLTFAQYFNDQSRIVELSGEAYFEVAKDPARPFVVKTNGQEVRVLGTHFNINSYTQNRSIRTTLLEGSVRVTASNSELILTPGYQAVLTGGQLSQAKADLEEAVSWKDGYFRFNNESITDIMSKLARWYDIDVAYEGDITDEGFTGTISRFKKISDVLAMLETTKTVHFKIEGRRVTVMR
ncbi:FecR family protein [Pedobacter faecalis]|uniref:FecR family protein n=1 Tax=Pedobacter faecalis TaxID=3041495 RepID=UPI00254F1B34|nr:FecR family protein [Pedobacter sp. ELA7]